MLLDKINHNEGTIIVGGKKYILNDSNFPSINPENPYELTQKEKEVVEKLKKGFINSEKLQRHIKFLYNKGSLYKIYNNNLLIHGCIPMCGDGSFKVYEDISGKKLKSKELLDYIDKIARLAYFADKNSQEKEYGKDFLWYLWCR